MDLQAPCVDYDFVISRRWNAEGEERWQVGRSVRLSTAPYIALRKPPLWAPIEALAAIRRASRPTVATIAAAYDHRALREDDAALRAGEEPAALAHNLAREDEGGESRAEPRAFVARTRPCNAIGASSPRPLLVLCLVELVDEQSFCRLAVVSIDRFCDRLWSPGPSSATAFRVRNLVRRPPFESGT